MTDFTDNKFFAQSDGPCVMIDSNSYKKLKEQAHKNQQDIEEKAKMKYQDIEEKAKMKYQEYLGKNDINVTFKIPSLNLIARGAGIIVPIEDEYSEYSSQYNYGEKIRYGIVERLTNDIEANFKDWRKDVRKLFNDLHQDMLRKMVRNTYTMIILYIIVIIETICLIFF